LTAGSAISGDAESRIRTEAALPSLCPQTAASERQSLTMDGLAEATKERISLFDIVSHRSSRWDSDPSSENARDVF
jgi:hypothetical protein